jgi:hypothetical protein
MSKFVVPFFCYRLFPFEQSILDLCMCLFYVLFQHTFTQVFPSAKIGRSAVVIPFYKKNSRYLLSLRLIRLVMFVVSCWKLLFLLILSWFSIDCFSFFGFMYTTWAERRERIGKRYSIRFTSVRQVAMRILQCLEWICRRCYLALLLDSDDWQKAVDTALKHDDFSYFGQIFRKGEPQSLCQLYCLFFLNLIFFFALWAKLLPLFSVIDCSLLSSQF